MVNMKKYTAQDMKSFADWCRNGLTNMEYGVEKLDEHLKDWERIVNMKRGDKIYLDKEETEESCVNRYLDCRDGIIERVEYIDCSGYGATTRLYLCENTKHEVISIVRQTWNDFAKEWIEEEMTFDSDSFKFLEALLSGKKEELGGKFETLRDYSNDRKI